MVRAHHSILREAKLTDLQESPHEQQQTLLLSRITTNIVRADHHSRDPGTLIDCVGEAQRGRDDDE